jgi:signal transduction histidine kinase
MNGMKRNLFIMGIAAFLLAGIVGLMAYQYNDNEKLFLTHLQKHQFTHADHLSDQIKRLLGGCRQVLRVIPVFTSNPAKDIQSWKSKIQNLCGNTEDDFITEISLIDDKGVTIYSTKSDAVGSNQSGSPVFSWAAKIENRGKMFISPDIRMEKRRNTSVTVRRMKGGDNPPRSFKILFAVPIDDSASAQGVTDSSGKFRGLLLFEVDLRKYILNELKDELTDSPSVWIIDRDGQLLFHSEFPQMAGVNLLQPNGTSLFQDTFPNVTEILERGQGTMDYKARDSSRQLLAFTSLKFENLSWIVGYSSPYESASAFVRKALRDSLLLLSAVALSFLLGFAYLMRASRMKLKAEEDSRHWQMLMEERKKREASLKKSADQLRYLSSRLLTIQEEERRRISNELHDGLGGALLALRLRENLMKKSLKADQGEQVADCEKTIGYIDQIMEEIHRLIRNLNPSVLEHLGLSAAIRGLANDCAKRNGTVVEVDMTDNIDNIFPQEAQRAIYRIFQEAFTNMEKYAQASSASVVIRENGDNVSFSIKDNGKGFDLAKIRSLRVTEKGLGLTIMEERVRTLGGHFTIWSEEGKATEISFLIPKAQRGEGEEENEYL